MNKKINSKVAAAVVVGVIALIIIMCLYPLRLLRQRSEFIIGEVSGYTQGIDSTHDAIQDFEAQYNRIDSIDVYVGEVLKGRYMRISFWDVDKWKMLYTDICDLGDKRVPGYVNIPLGIDIEVGKNYRLIMTSDRSTYTVGVTNIENVKNPAVKMFYYQDTEVPDKALAAIINYSVPVSKTLSLFIMGGILLVAAVVIFFLIKAGKKSDNIVTVQKVLQITLNPIFTVIYLVLAVMVFPLKKFDDRVTDIIFYEAGLLIAYLFGIFFVNHKRNEHFRETIVDESCIYEKIRPFLQTVFVALTMQFGCEYMNGLYTIFHTVAERKLIASLLFVIIFSFTKRELFNILNLFCTGILGIIGIIYYFLHRMPVSEKEADLNNIALFFGIVICIETVVILVNIICVLSNRKFRVRHIAKRKKTFLLMPVIVFAALMIIFRYGKWWGIVMTLAFSCLYFRYYISMGQSRWIKIVSNGLILQAMYSVVFCMAHRYMVGFYSGRYAMMFHTVTVTAEYLTVMQVVSAALLISKIAVITSKVGFLSVMKKCYKEMLFFGVMSSYMILTESRTGFQAFLFSFFAMIVLLVIRNRKETLRCIGRIIVLNVAALLLCFPMTFSLQRMIPLIVGHPVIYEVDDFVADACGSKDWDDYSYLCLERFTSLFMEKILGVDGLDYNYPEDPFNYGENGEELYDQDGNLLNKPSGKPSIRPADTVAIAKGQEVEVANASEESNIKVTDETLPKGDSESESGGIAEYSNGRLDIWKAYLKDMNLTGHAVMSMDLPNGENVIHAHNVYVQVAHDYGIIAGIVFGIIIVAAFFISGYYFICSRKIGRLLVVFSIVSGFAFAGLTEWNFQMCNPMTIALMFAFPVILFPSMPNKDGLNNQSGR